jgi:hypothetical protein
LTRRRARAPRGERAVGRVPRNHGPNVTRFAALTPQGIGPAMVVTGGADRPACETDVRQLLVPKWLRSLQSTLMKGTLVSRTGRVGTQFKPWEERAHVHRGEQSPRPPVL